jgi:hypothetical protein
VDSEQKRLSSEQERLYSEQERPNSEQERLYSEQNRQDSKQMMFDNVSLRDGGAILVIFSAADIQYVNSCIYRKILNLESLIELLSFNGQLTV